MSTDPKVEATCAPVADALEAAAPNEVKEEQEEDGRPEERFRFKAAHTALQKYEDKCYAEGKNMNPSHYARDQKCVDRVKVLKAAEENAFEAVFPHLQFEALYYAKTLKEKRLLLEAEFMAVQHEIGISDLISGYHDCGSWDDNFRSHFPSLKEKLEAIRISLKEVVLQELRSDSKKSVEANK